MNEEQLIKDTANYLIQYLNGLEKLIAERIKAKKAKPNKSGFTSAIDSQGIGAINSLQFSADWNRQKAKESFVKAEANQKKAGSAMWFGDNEQRHEIVADAFEDFIQDLTKLFKHPEVNIATSWPELKGEVKAVEIPVSEINKLREKQGLKPLSQK